MSVYFKCKNCHQEHLSPLFFADADAFDHCDLGALNLTCAKSGKSSRYEKRDMWWVRDWPKRVQSWHSRRSPLQFCGMTVASS